MENDKNNEPQQNVKGLQRGKFVSGLVVGFIVGCLLGMVAMGGFIYWAFFLCNLCN